jgi:hypothetical protein
MLGGFVRLIIVVVTLGIAWNATGDVMASAWVNEPWKGYAGALGVELVLGYSIFIISKTQQKAIVGMMIFVFGLFSICAQILHSWVFGTPLPDEILAKIPSQIAWAWQYLLPSVPTIAGMSVGLLDVAEKSGFHEEQFFQKIKDTVRKPRPNSQPPIR